MSSSLAISTEGLAGLGYLDEAGAKLERAVASTKRHGEGWYQAELARMRGELMLLRSKGQQAIEAEDCFRTANDIAREQGALFWELRIAVSLARLRMTQGRHGEVGQLVAPVYDRFTEGFDTPVLRAARALLLGEQST